MKKFKKIISVCLALVLLMGATSAYYIVGAADGDNYMKYIFTDKYEISIIDETKMTARLFCINNSAVEKDGTLTIPKYVAGYQIVELGGEMIIGISDGYLEKVTKVIIPDGVKSITCNTWEPYNETDSGHSQLFENLKNLQEAVIPADFEMCKYMFSNCKNLKKVTFEGDIFEIPAYAFSGCENLSEINIPDSVGTIGKMAFYNCKALSGKFRLPKALKSLGYGAFADCTKLKGFKVDGENLYFSQKNGVLFDKEQTKLYCYPAGKTAKEYKLPATVKTIVKYAFSGAKKLEKVTLSSSMTTVTNYTFSGSNIKNIICPKSVTRIKKYAFLGCEKTLKNLTVKNKNCKFAKARGFSNYKFTVHGYKNSTAQKFAEKAGLKFVKL